MAKPGILRASLNALSIAATLPPIISVQNSLRARRNNSNDSHSRAEWSELPALAEASGGSGQKPKQADYSHARQNKARTQRTQRMHGRTRATGRTHPAGKWCESVLPPAS